jgi:hypothetical protein
MDWLFWHWEETALGSSSDLLGGETARPSAVELFVIKLTYQAIAGQSCCGKCGASLNRPLRLSFGRSPFKDWCVVVATRCSGWKRHRHAALVTDTSRDLLLGPLQVR